MGIPMRMKILCGMLVIILAGCRCGEKEEEKGAEHSKTQKYESTVSKLPRAKFDRLAELIPADSNLVILSGGMSRLMKWLEGRQWYKELKESPLIQDIRTTGGMIRLSTLKHRLESVSAVRMGEASIERLLSRPTALATRSSDKGTEWVLVKEIDLEVQALDRLVEVLNQVAPREGIISKTEISGRNARDLQLSGNMHIYYLLFSNLLIASNSKDYMQLTLGLLETPENSILSEKEIGLSLVEDQEEFDIITLIDTVMLEDSKLHWMNHFLPCEKLLLKLRSGKQARLEITALEIKEEKGKQNNPCKAADMIPIDSRMVLGFADARLSELWGDILERSNKPRKLVKRLKIDPEKDLFKRLDSQMSLVLTGVDLSGSHPVPHLAAVLKTDKPEEITEAMSKLFTFAFGTKPKKKTLKNMSGSVVYEISGKRSLKPAFAVVDAWLVVGTTSTAVESIVSTSLGKQPSIKDEPGFSSKIAGLKKPAYMFGYLDCDSFFEDLKGYLKSIVELEGRYEADELEQTIDPFFNALKKIGKLGGLLAGEKDAVTGTVVPL